MSKIAFVFPGQGAQYLGMGQEIAGAYPLAKEVFERASRALGYDMEELCFNSSDEKLRLTAYTQPSILTVSYAIAQVLQEKGIKPDMVAGLSLGEYTALTFAQVFSFEDAVRVVTKRGQYMQEEVADGVGGMAAILGLEASLVEEACSQVDGLVSPANYNCPGQLVIAGEVEAVEQAIDLCKEKGAKKAVKLPVSAPFHTQMLKGAGDKLRKEIDALSLQKASLPIVNNVRADYALDQEIPDLLQAQVSSPVQWQASVEFMIQEGVTTFIEVGPGKSLSKFIKKIDKSVTICQVEDLASLEKTMGILEETYE